MIGKGKSISHGVAALEYDLAKEINGQAVATEIARHELYGCTGAEMVQEMKPYHIDFPNVKNNCLRFEVSPSIEESATFTDADWAELGNDFMQRMKSKPTCTYWQTGFPFPGNCTGTTG
ncbi:relaxase/mobilization nuclease domain-containing protein (plasmid) [Bacteroides fragilis]|nr:relaxase/mobilization nuclease domain-containing protein [Bacteroides fragilis]